MRNSGLVIAHEAAGSSEARFGLRWRPGQRGDQEIATAPWLCVAAFRRLCSGQRCDTSTTRCDGRLLGPEACQLAARGGSPIRRR